MTTLKSIFSLFVLVFITTAATSQARFNDPGVSVHNYKHPHKARQAARQAQNNDKVGSIQATRQTAAPADMRHTARNYKAGNPTGQVNDALVVLPGRGVEYTPNPLMAKDNYKRQHRPAAPAKIPARPAEELAEGEKDNTQIPD